jgi:hypothetical protein
MPYFQLDPAIKLRAGFRTQVTEGPDALPFYFDCAACNAQEPVIAGVLADAPADTGRLAFDRIGILTDPLRGPRHAVFCATCFAKFMAETGTDPLSEPTASAVGSQQQEQTQQQQTPMPQTSATTTPRTRTVLFTKELDRKNAVRFQEVPVEGQAPVCGTLYLQKWFCGTAQNVRLQVEVQ